MHNGRESEDRTTASGTNSWVPQVSRLRPGILLVKAGVETAKERKAANLNRRYTRPSPACVFLSSISLDS